VFTVTDADVRLLLVPPSSVAENAISIFAALVPRFKKKKKSLFPFFPFMVMVNS
jgi:hypothetical protein